MTRPLSSPCPNRSHSPKLVAGEGWVCTDCAENKPPHPLAAAMAARDAGMARAMAGASADVKARLTSAIRRLAATGRVFSMNNLRGEVPDATGPVVGAVFGDLSRNRVIEHVGYEPSTKASTKAHDIKTWKGRAT